MKLGSATISVFVEIAVCVQIRERGRIGHPFVEFADLVDAVHLGLLGCRMRVPAVTLNPVGPPWRRTSWHRAHRRSCALRRRVSLKRFPILRALGLKTLG